MSDKGKVVDQPSQRTSVDLGRSKGNHLCVDLVDDIVDFLDVIGIREQLIASNNVGEELHGVAGKMGRMENVEKRLE